VFPLKFNSVKETAVPSTGRAKAIEFPNESGRGTPREIRGFAPRPLDGFTHHERMLHVAPASDDADGLEAVESPRKPLALLAFEQGNEGTDPAIPWSGKFSPQARPVQRNLSTGDGIAAQYTPHA
jgi:hypothetical protein